jgi:hypothetical protein
MITGFNTDVPHEGQVYHVQTEDGGHDHPVLESLIYIGGTIVAKKMTPYADKLTQGADEQMIAGLLKRQHQVIIAAIKSGRVEELIQRYADQQKAFEKPEAVVNKRDSKELKAPKPKRNSKTQPALDPSEPAPARPEPVLAKPQPRVVALAERPPVARTTSMLGSPRRPEPPQPKPVAAAPLPAQPAPAVSVPIPSLAEARPTTTTTRRPTGTLDLDQVINEYMKRNNEQGKLDLTVITPNAFIAGKTVALRVQVLFNAMAEAEAVVTIKIIGTAFKPQVYIGRAGRDGIANFSLSLPGFTAGTAAIVIEAQSNRGRGELKHLIRRA